MNSNDQTNNNEDTVPLELPSLDLPSVDKKRSSNNDFMSDIVKVANEVNKAIILISGIVPQKKIDADKFDVLRGHLIRLYKLYDSFLFLIVSKRAEVAFILLRSLSETVISLQYLLKHIDTDVHKKYKRASLSYENKLQESILENISIRKEQLPIESRMLESIEQTFSRAGVDNLEKEELQKTKWGLEPSHLDISGKAKNVELYPIYEHLFQTSSHYVHGSWHELDFCHLEQTKDSYGYRQQQLHYTLPKPQMMEAVSIFVMEVLQKYLLEIMEDSEHGKDLETYLDSMSQWFYAIIQKHEEFLKKE